MNDPFVKPFGRWFLDALVWLCAEMVLSHIERYYTKGTIPAKLTAKCISDWVKLGVAFQARPNKRELAITMPDELVKKILNSCKR